MKRIFQLLLLLTLAAGACAPVNYQPSAGGDDEFEAETFSTALARGYGLLAEYEEYVAGSAANAAIFKKKAQQALSGREVEPGDVRRTVSADARPEMEQARERLMSMRDGIDSGWQERRLAEAQVNFDCWLSRSNTPGAMGAAGCREMFFKAMEGLSGRDVASFIATFNPNEATPGRDAMAVIRQAAAAYEKNPSWHVHVTGHANQASGRESDTVLSMRRALAVRNALVQNGVNPDKITLAAIGEKKRQKGRTPGGETSEFARVDIALMPEYLDLPSKGSDITQKMPEHFGSRGPDF